MALFEFKADGVTELRQVTFGAQGVRERADLQRVLRSNLGVVSPDTLILAEEFGDWSEGKRRIDLLGLDRQASLVVIELKRTEDGGHMELQAIRYAAMVSTMTFEQAVAARAEFRKQHAMEGDAQAELLDFLGWDAPNEDHFAQSVRIVLVSADFSKELTSSVMWLNDYGLDIRCVRLRPYALDGRLVLDVQQIIPLPEAADFQVQVREKAQKERQARESSVDFTRFDVSFGDTTLVGLWKRGAILAVVRKLVESGTDPAKVAEALDLPVQKIWRKVTGNVHTERFRELASNPANDGTFDVRRWFCEEDELMHFGGDTYAFSNQWGGGYWHGAMQRLATAFPSFGIKYAPTEGRTA